MADHFNSDFNLDAIENLEHRHVCQDAAGYVRAVLDSLTGNYYYVCEHRVSMVNPDIAGTADMIIYNGHNIHIIDFKFGAHVFVDVKDNPQLMAYAVGAAYSAKTEVLYATTHVVQPRKDNYEHQLFLVKQLFDFEKAVDKAVSLAMSPTPPYHPGNEQCMWCDGRAICPAAKTMADEQASTAFALYADVKQLKVNMAELIEFYQNLPQLEGYIKAIKDFMFTELVRGGNVPGYKLVKTRAKRVWTDEVEAMKAIEAADLDVDNFFVHSFISPAQAEKLAGKKVIAPLVTTGEGTLAIASEDDERPAHNSNPFGGYEDV